MAQQSQPQAEPRMAFEVASIRPNPSEENRTPYGNKDTPGGITDYKYIGISNLIRRLFVSRGATNSSFRTGTSKSHGRSSPKLQPTAAWRISR